MKRTPPPFIENRPETKDEMVDCLEDSGWSPREVTAYISHEVWDPKAAGETGVNMTGYSAEVQDNEDGESLFTTNGFEKREDLTAALDAVRIKHEDVE